MVLTSFAGLFLNTSQLIGIAMQTPVLPSHGRIIRIREVIAMTGLSRSSIYAAIKQGTFPAQLKLSTRSSGWLESEVIEWREMRPRGSQRED